MACSGGMDDAVFGSSVHYSRRRGLALGQCSRGRGLAVGRASTRAWQTRCICIQASIFCSAVRAWRWIIAPHARLARS